MRRHPGPALPFILLLTLAALQGCGGEEPSVNTNAIHNTNANATPAATPEGTPVAGIDQIRARMKDADIAFNVPPSVKLDEVQTIELLLSPTQKAPELERQLKQGGAVGEVKRHTIKISDKMQAVISGDGFQITPITPDTQPVSMQEPTSWKWDVRALRGGTLKLNVILNALVDLKDGAGQRPYFIKSFDQVYVVEVPSPSPAPAAAHARTGRVWAWLLPALLVPAGGAAAWLWLRGRKGRRAASRWFDPGAGGPRIFLSYRRDDAAGHAGRLRDSLAERFGPERVFMDLESIRAGDDFVEIVKQAVDTSGVVVVVIGRQWLSALDKKGNRRLDNPQDFVRLEVETALRRGARVIPALVQGAEMPAEDALPEPLAMLARRNAVEISDSRWTFDVDRLGDAIEEALARGPAKPPDAVPLKG